MTAVVWFRRDLRVHDHPALRAALADHDSVVPVFCFDDRLLHGRHASGPRTQFMLECLADLDRALRSAGPGWSSVTARRSASCRRLPRETGSTEIHHTYDVNSVRPRPRAPHAASAADAGLELVAHPGLTVVDDVARCVPPRAGPTRSSPRSSAPGSGSPARGAGRSASDRAARRARPGPAALARAARPASRRSRSRCRAARARGAGASRVSARAECSTTRRPRRARRGPHLPPLALPQVRLHLAPRGRGAAARRRGAAAFRRQLAGVTSTSR